MSIQSIKRSQKESLLYRAISNLFGQTALDDARLEGLMINRVKLSNDKSVATIFFYIAGGQEAFDQKLPVLVLYKASLRRALAHSIASRYTPELVFKYDSNFEKQQQIEHLLDKIKGEDPSSS